VERMSRREGVGRGKNGQQERLRERGSAFIRVPWLEVHGALIEPNRRARAVFLDGVVSWV
jgi:hypothetical protein